MERVLLLNATYEPCGHFLAESGHAPHPRKVEVLETYNRVVNRSPSPFVCPRSQAPHSRPFSRADLRFFAQNIYLRDRCQCQYCGKVMDVGRLTYDHVVPRSSAGLQLGEHRDLLSSLQQAVKADERRSSEDAT